MTTNPNKFQGYEAEIQNPDGSTHKVFVVNSSPSRKVFAALPPMPALKIKKMFYAGMQGWSGGCRPTYKYGPAYWVHALKVIPLIGQPAK